jgi:hypothetical protein
LNPHHRLAFLINLAEAALDRIMDMDINFADMAMDFDALDVLPSYNLSQKSSVDRVGRLRQLMNERGLAGYLIVDSDAHYTFYSQARQDRRINYITNSEVPHP